MKKLIVFLTLIVYAVICLCGCEPVPEGPFVRHFVVKKDNHYSTPRLAEMLQSDRLIFKAKFDESAMYDLGNEALQSSKNKLLGFSDCNSSHHENSARVGWQWFNNRLEIYAYCYVNSNRVEQFLGTVNLHEINRYEIRLTKDAYVFYLNDEELARVQRSENACDKGVYYLLYPYFGGSIPAPHDVHIDLEILR